MQRQIHISGIFWPLGLCSNFWLAQQHLTQTENPRSGSPDWELAGPSGTPTVESQASRTSVIRGETIRFFVSTSAPTCTMAIYRMGWYAGAGARLMSSVTLPGK